jgi:hypothetical protein
VFWRVLIIGVPLCKVVLSPVVEGLSFAIQENVVLATLEVSPWLIVPPLQMLNGAIGAATGVGFTSTFTCWVGPVQPLAIGVTIYVTVWLLVVAFTKTSVMVDPDCDAVVSPVTLVFGFADHVKVAPATFETNVKPTPELLQTSVAAKLVITGVGLTATFMICEGPLHPFRFGVTV